jgi:hypothetical protein
MPDEKYTCGAHKCPYIPTYTRINLCIYVVYIYIYIYRHIHTNRGDKRKEKRKRNIDLMMHVIIDY